MATILHGFQQNKNNRIEYDFHSDILSLFLIKKNVLSY